MSFGERVARPRPVRLDAAVGCTHCGATVELAGPVREEHHPRHDVVDGRVAHEWPEGFQDLREVLRWVRRAGVGAHVGAERLGHDHVRGDAVLRALGRHHVRQPQQSCFR